MVGLTLQFLFGVTHMHTGVLPVPYSYVPRQLQVSHTDSIGTYVCVMNVDL